MLERDLNFVSDSSEILTELFKSKNEGNSIGIRSPLFGNETIVTAVEDILVQESNTLVVLKPYDRTGYILAVNKINLSEITGVCPFCTPFTNPYLNNIDRNKTWHF